ncbi:MAG TPA: oxygenase MpaB family protein [Kineosporiaceae bacterium]|nr:oxygenase MpaB family protein [Kineosporiaceae bacterium]
MAAHGWLRRIEQLDPEKDHQEIYRISSGYEFPWDYTRALELALFRTYCVPSISALLDATGEFRQRPQRRYDDTALLMSEMVEHGYDSERGREALRVINRVHHRYVIDNDDLRYVLSTFIFEPIDWIDRFGWRRLTEAERLAGFHFYREVGLRMGIKDLPTGPVEFRQFKQDYERDTFRWTETNQRVGTYTLELLSSWYPAPVRPFVRKAVRGLLDEPMLTAFGFPPTSRGFSRAEHLGLRARALVAGLLPPRRTSALSNQGGNRSYPGYPTGYRPADLGAPPPPADLHPKWLRGGLRAEEETGR